MNHYAIAGFLTFLTSFTLGIIVYLKNPRKRINSLFALFSISVAIYGFGFYQQAIALTVSQEMVAIKVLLGGTIFIPVFFMQMAYSILEKKMSRKITFFVYATAITLEAINFFTVWLAKDPIPKFSFNYLFQAGPLYSILIFFFSACATTGLWQLFYGYRSAGGLKRNQIKYVFLSTLIGFGGGSAGFLLGYNANLYPLNPFGAYCVSLYNIMFAYAIIRHHLMDIEVVIKKTAFYSILTALLTALFVSLIIVSQQLLSGITGYTSFIATVIGSFIIALLFQPIREIVQRGVDKVFFHARYSYQTILSRYSQMLKKPMENLDRFARIAPYLIRKSMRLSSVSLMVFDSKERRCLIRSAAGKISRQLVGSSLPMDSPLIEELLRRRGEICRDEKDLPLKAAEEMDWLKADLIIPCISESKSFSHPTLLAAVNLGKKLSDEAFSVEDITFLKIMANQAATAIENVALYEENLKAEKQLLLADKLSSLGRVAAGLAHEIKNPLTAIKGMTQALERNPGDQETIRDFNAIIPKEVDRLTRLVENLSNLGKAPKFQLTKVGINTLLENNLKLFESRCRKQGINLVKEFGPVPEIETDGERLTQVFTNLILNAIQAMPDGGMLTIQTKQQTNITIEISDTGYGIPEDKIKDIFEPFFTTKEEGTGLGLAITHKIIKDLGGEISVESKPGKGTRFRIMLLGT